MTTAAATHLAPTASHDWLVSGQSPKKLLDDLLNRPDAVRLVRDTPIQPLFLFIQSLGLADAQELVARCSPEQFRGFVDLDAWERDEMKLERLTVWLEQLLELPPSRLALHVSKLDPELVTAYLSRLVRVYDLSEEDTVPEEAEGVFFETPDRFFVVDILSDPDGGHGRTAFLQRFLDRLYRGDLELARTVLNAARWEPGSETDELSYRFRCGRLADMGFVDYYDALRIYSEVDVGAEPPHRAQPFATIDEARATGLGGFLELQRWRNAWADTPDLVVQQSMGRLDVGTQQNLFEELLYLANQAMSADRVPFSDAAQFQATLSKTVGYLHLGYAHLRKQRRAESDQPVDADVMVRLLKTVPLTHVFRVGYTLTLHVRKMAKLLVDSGATSLVPQKRPAALLPTDEAGAFLALLEARPMFPRFLDDRSQNGTRPFAALLDLHRAGLFLAQLGERPRFLSAGLGLRLDVLEEVLSKTVPNDEEATWDDVLGTMLANHLLGRPAALVPLGFRDLGPLRRFLDEETMAWPASVVVGIWKMLEARLSERDPSSPTTVTRVDEPQRAFVDRVLVRVARSLAVLPRHIDEATSVPRLDGLLLAV